MYAYISEKNEISVKTAELREIIRNFKSLIFKKYLENIIKIFAQIAVNKQTKPTRELINIFYSNNQNSLNFFLLKRAYSFHRVLQKL